MIVNQVGLAGIILGRLDFEFSKFSGKKLSKIKIFLFQKNQGIKIFFYPINVDIRHPVQLFLLTLCGEFFWTIFQNNYS